MSPPSPAVARLPPPSYADTKEIDAFVETLARFERGEIDADQWRAYRVVRGAYAQRQDGVHMLRVKVPQGLATAEQLRARYAADWRREFRSRLIPDQPALYYDWMIHTSLGDAHFIATAPNVPATMTTPVFGATGPLSLNRASLRRRSTSSTQVPTVLACGTVRVEFGSCAWLPSAGAYSTGSGAGRSSWASTCGARRG